MVATPLIFAHRGARAAAPENTLPAFEKAVVMGADGIECDVLLSADGVPVVIHDEQVDDLTDGSGKVSSMTVDALKGLDAGSHFGEAFAGVRIPTLAETVEALPRDFWLNIELKGTQTDALPQAVAEVLRSTGRGEPLVISSFNPHMLNAAQEAMPDIPRGFLTLPRVAHQGWDATYVQWWHPNHEGLRAEDVEQAHAAGHRVNVWTVNDAADITQMTQLGVDGIITDHPDRVLDIING
jgi:glycerophosphoryl diester phosphodiesterase